MIRDKAWLTNEIEIMGRETSENYPHEQMVEREVVLNLIEQLDEPDRVIIPQFVADWISQAKKWGYSISDSMGLVTFYADTTQYDKAMRWARYNQDIFARAWLDGYEVEKEKLYYVIDKSRKPLIKAFKEEVGMSVCNITVEEAEALEYPNFKYRLTEKQIKDYDERYWSFAVEVVG